jgi:hypothetical protein
VAKNIKIPDDLHARLAVGAAKATQRIGEYTTHLLRRALAQPKEAKMGK